MTPQENRRSQGQSRACPWERVGRALAYFASFTLFAIMWLTFIDVLGRDLFNAPLPGGFETIELLMGIMLFAILPVLTVSEEHVVVTILDDVIPAAWRAVQRLAINLLSAVALGVLGWRLWDVAEKQARYHDATMFLQVPLAPVSYFMAAATAVAALLALMLVVSPSPLRRPPAEQA
jgi:TRAP-type C4-dicarboxylate transport system permease small subunit